MQRKHRLTSIIISHFIINLRRTHHRLSQGSAIVSSVITDMGQPLDFGDNIDDNADTIAMTY